MEQLLSSQDLLDFLQPLPSDLCQNLGLDSNCGVDFLSSNSDSGSINYCSDQSSTPSPISEIPNTFSPPQEISASRIDGKKLSKPITKKKRVQKEGKVTHFTLDRELLLTMSLDEFESRIEELSKGKAITKEESNDIKRQRRLIKNRQSAMASRERKKEEMSVLKQENEALRKEISYLKSFIDFLTVGKPIENLENVPSVPVLMIFGLLFGLAILLPSSYSSLFTTQSNNLLVQNNTLPIPSVQHDISTQIKQTKILNFNHKQPYSMKTSTEFNPLGRELLLMNDFNDTSVYEKESDEMSLLEKLNTSSSSDGFKHFGVRPSSETYSPVISL